MTAVEVEFDHFVLLFLDCDEVYNHVSDNSGSVNTMPGYIAKTLKSSKIYVKIDYNKIEKYSSNRKRWYWGHTFAPNVGDVLKGVYLGIFKTNLSEFDFTSMTVEEAELLLYLNEYVPFDENIDVRIK